MSASDSLPTPYEPTPAALKQSPPSRIFGTPEMIDRLATEMRARCGGELPHSFYVAQVKRKLAGKTVQTTAANDETGLGEKPSVFHAWALRE